MTNMRMMYKKLVEKILDVAITAAIGELTSFVAAWGWNQAAVQEMRRKFEGLLSWTERVNPTAQQSNTENLRVQQLLRQLEDVARQGKDLLDGEPTARNLSNAKARFEKIIVVMLELNDLLLINSRDVSTLLAGFHLKIERSIFGVGPDSKLSVAVTYLKVKTEENEHGKSRFKGYH